MRGLGKRERGPSQEQRPSKSSRQAAPRKREEPGTLSTFRMMEELDMLVIPPACRPGIASTNHLSHVSDQQVDDMFYDSIRDYFDKVVHEMRTEFPLRASVEALFGDKEEFLRVLVKATTNPMKRIGLASHVGDVIAWRDITLATVVKRGSVHAGVYMGLLWNGDEMRVRIGEDGRGRAFERLEKMVREKGRIRDETFGNMASTETVYNDGSKYAFIGLMAWDMGLVEPNRAKWGQNWIDYSFAIEFFWSKYMITARIAKEEELAWRHKSVKPGNETWGGRGGPYKDDAERDRNKEAKRRKVLRSHALDLRLVEGGLTIEYNIDQDRPTDAKLSIVYRAGSSKADFGTSHHDVFDPLYVYAIDRLENGTKGKLFWDPMDEMVVNFGKGRKWSLKVDREDEIFFHPGARKVLTRTYKRIANLG